MRFSVVRWLSSGFLGAAVLTAVSHPAVAQKPVESGEQTVVSADPRATEVPLPGEVKQPGSAIAEDGIVDGIVDDVVDDDQPRPTPAARPKESASPDEDQVAESESVEADGETEPPADNETAQSEDSATPDTQGDDSALQPIPDPLDTSAVKIETASFNKVRPGVTTMAQVEESWGAPREIRKQGNGMAHLYGVAPFNRVEVNFYRNRVTSIIIRLDRVFPAKTIAEQLELTDVRPVLVSDDRGEILGQVYPERGVLFAFEPGDAPGRASMKVAEIILEPVSAEAFVLRAETYLESQPESSLLDVQNALKLEPGNARAHWLHARLMIAAGDDDRSATAAAEAVRLDPDNPHYLVTYAQVLSRLGRQKEAILQAGKAVRISRRRPHVKARALCLLGDLIASGPTPDYNDAIRYHMQAVKTADALSADPHPAIRLAAKEVLVDAHLAGAYDIAWGSWKQKNDAVGVWLERASQYADDLIENEGSGEDLRLRVAVRALGTCVGLRGAVDPADWIEKVLHNGKELVAAADDPKHKAQLQWDIGMALYDTLQIYQMRSDHEAALRYGEQAIEYLESGKGQAQVAEAGFLLGRLYFRLGAIRAIRDENHRAAISWFDKAAPLLKKPLSDRTFTSLGRHGETFVSMGVSYWETGQRQKAVELTEFGVELMERAVKQGTLDEIALAVPYTNLASMHRQLGADDTADEYQQMATKAKSTKVQ